MNKPECRIHTNGTKYWCLNGELHREDGPAVEYADGTKYWCLNGKYHREEINPETGLTMPAIEFANGKTRYWINGNYIPQLDNKRIYGKDNLTKYLILL